MKDHSDLVRRLNERSAEKEQHGGLSAEAADAIERLMRERKALLSYIERDCEHCAKQDECEHFSLFEFPHDDGCEWEWDEDIEDI